MTAALKKFPLLVTLATAGTLPGASAADPLDALVADSPFFAGKAPPAASTEADITSLTFRGVMQEKGESYFSIFDATSGQSGWVKLREAGRPYFLSAFDSAREELTISYQGRELRLRLVEAHLPAADGDQAVTAANQRMRDAAEARLRERREQRLAAQKSRESGG